MATRYEGESVKLGRSPKHAKEATEALRRHYGVTSAYFDPQTGNAKWTDLRGRNALIQFSGAIDSEAGYGDYCGK
jgi:hypothetical protein